MKFMRALADFEKTPFQFFVLLIWAVRIGILLLLLAAAFYVDLLNNERYKQAVEANLARDLGDIRMRLESIILQNIQVVRGLSASIALEPNMEQARFAELSSILLKSGVQLRNLGAAPDFVIKLMYPLAGNEAAIGLDLRTDQAQWLGMQAVVDRDSMAFVGPFPLVQGGLALAGRVPVYNHHTGKLWGVISTVMDLDVLLEAARVNDNLDFKLQLSKPGAEGAASEIFFGAHYLFGKKPLVNHISILDNDWLMSAEPLAGWPVRADNAWGLRGFLLLMILAIGGSAFWITRLIILSHFMQRRLVGLFQLSPMGIALRDVQSDRFIVVNHAFAKMLGYSVGELINKTDAELTVDASGTVNQEIAHRLSCDSKFGPLEKTYQKHNQDLIPVAINGLLMHESSGKLVAWQIVEDISERKKIEQMKSEFVSTVSHELRTPLTSIAGSLGVVTSGALGTLPVNIQTMLDIAYKNSQRLNALINDLLDMEKLVSGQMRLAMQTTDVVGLIKATMQEMKAYADQYAISLAMCVPTDEVMVPVDPQRFVQVVANLLSNAIKFSPLGETVTVTLSTTQNTMMLSIVDRGVGIPASFQPQIFQKFAQADASDTRQTGGTGLGLAISQELVARMNGEIGFESEVGKTRFFFSLPLATIND